MGNEYHIYILHWWTGGSGRKISLFCRFHIHIIIHFKYNEKNIDEKCLKLFIFPSEEAGIGKIGTKRNNDICSRFDECSQMNEFRTSLCSNLLAYDWKKIDKKYNFTSKLAIGI